IITPDRRTSSTNDVEMELSKVENLIASFDQNREYFGPLMQREEEATKSRLKFVTDFPTEKILDMNINNYVFGRTDPTTGEVDESTFCYRIEFRVPGFGGIRGTPAGKFGIYVDKKTQEYVYDD